MASSASARARDSINAFPSSIAWWSFWLISPSGSGKIPAINLGRKWQPRGDDAAACSTR